MSLDAFFRTHAFLVEHNVATVRRALMDEINWNDRLIGIKGTRGVGKTSFLLQYAREHFSVNDHKCLYINMNNFYFQGKTISQFAGEFHQAGGMVLLIDQVFKDPNWSEELRRCYELYPELHIVFTGSSVMRLKEDNPILNGIAKSYNLRGFSFREYLNLVTGQHFRKYTLDDILSRHELIASKITNIVDPKEHFRNYLHHGFYPFFLEQANFSENLLKVMNMMIEVDILLIQQIELKYLDKIKKLLYRLATTAPSTPNVSQLATDVQTSRATVMNYIKYLSDARMLNTIYQRGDKFPKKPARVMMHNTNLMYAIYPRSFDEQTLMETFFANALWAQHTVSNGDRSCTYYIGQRRFRITNEEPRRLTNDVIHVRYDILKGHDKQIPIWLFGLLY